MAAGDGHELPGTMEMSAAALSVPGHARLDGAEVLDTVAPVVTVLSPAPGSIITKSTPFEVQVTDEVALRRVLVWAAFAGRSDIELAWDGGAFVGRYVDVSTVALAAGSTTLTLVRQGGWPGSPTFHVYAVDTAANEAA